MANMSSMPAFYIIVPGFNVSKYLNDLAQSLSRQSYKGLKTAIFVDDGSSDSTLQIMETLDIEGFRKHVIPIDHGGLSIARNAALTWVTRNADDGYIIFLDADDMLTDNALQTIADRIAREHLDILTFNTQVFYESTRLEQSFPTYRTYYQRTGSYPNALTGQEYLSSILANGDFRPNVCLRAFSVGFLRKTQLAFYPDIIHEDNLFSFQALLLAKSVRYIDQQLSLRRIRTGSIMTTPTGVANLDGYFRCAIEAMDFIGRHRAAAASADDCATLIGMLIDAAVDHYNDIDADQIQKLISSYTPHDQVLFAILVQKRVQTRREHEDSIVQTASEAQAEAENAVRLQFENSISYKLGRALTAIPRKLLGR